MDLEKKINDSRIFLGLEQMNRKREKERLLEDNKKLSNKVLKLEERLKTLDEEMDESRSDDSFIQELEDQVKSLNERNKVLNVTCAQLTRKSLDYLKQIKELEEDKRKNISMLAQRNDKFERMLKLGKEDGDMTGLDYFEAIASTSTQKPKKN